MVDEVGSLKVTLSTPSTKSHVEKSYCLKLNTGPEEVTLVTSLHSQWQTTRLHSVHGHRDSHLEARANPRRDLTKLEHYELNKYGLAVFRLGPSATFGFEARSDMEAKAAEKSAFDLKLKKYDAAVKIKIIKEVRTFMDLGLKEAKELVEKVPVVNEK
nr:50s ribosomal protein l12, chloroplastic [Quercus suber]